MTTYKALLTVFSPDRVGLISEVSGLLFDQGINIGDTSFSILLSVHLDIVVVSHSPTPSTVSIAASR